MKYKIRSGPLRGKCGAPRLAMIDQVAGQEQCGETDGRQHDATWARTTGRSRNATVVTGLKPATPIVPVRVSHANQRSSRR